MVRRTNQLVKQQENRLSQANVYDNNNNDEKHHQHGHQQHAHNHHNHQQQGSASTDYSSYTNNTTNTPDQKQMYTNDPQSSHPPANNEQGNPQPHTDMDTMAMMNNLNMNMDNIDLGNITNIMQDDTDALLNSAGSMGAAATLRYQKARIGALQEALERMAEEKSQAEDKHQDALLALQRSGEEGKRLKKSLLTSDSQSQKQKTAHGEAQKKIKALERELSVWRKEMAVMEKDKKRMEKENREKDVKLNRALHDADRYRMQAKNNKDSKREADGTLRQELNQLRMENRRLMQQKGEMLTAFKKQFKLIDILKRQKLHVETAKMLQFTEEEFGKTLEISV